MKKEDILQFDEDDASEMSVNGKQVFFTKRINGKTTHNKIEAKEQDIDDSNNEEDDIEEKTDFDIEFEFPKIKENIKKGPEKKKFNTDKKNEQKNNLKKNANKKKINKKRKKRKIVKLFMLLLIISGIVIFTLISPVFNIEDIRVLGNEKIESDTIISLSEIKKGNNIFRISKDEISKKIKENSYISKVEIKRIFPGTIELTVEERDISYQIKVINGYVYVDNQGYILEVSSKSSKVPVVEGFFTEEEVLLNEKRVKKEDFENLKVLLKIMNTAKKNGISNKINKIKIQKNEYVLELDNENKIVYLGDELDIRRKVEYLGMILEQDKEIKDKKGTIYINGNLNNGFEPYFSEYKEKTEEKKEDKKENGDNIEDKKEQKGEKNE